MMICVLAVCRSNFVFTGLLSPIGTSDAPTCSLLVVDEQPTSVLPKVLLADLLGYACCAMIHGD